MFSPYSILYAVALANLYAEKPTEAGLNYKKFIGSHNGFLSVKEIAEVLNKELLQQSKSFADNHKLPGVDIVFVLDGSSSVGYRNFVEEKNFVAGLVKRLGVSPSGVRVALVTFGSTARVEFPLNQFVNKECTTRAVIRARYIGGKPEPVTTLATVTKVFQNHNRRNLRKIIFIVTGDHKESPILNRFTLSADERLKAIQLFVVVVSPRARERSMQRLTNLPMRGHVLRVKSFAVLGRISHAVRSLGKHVCSVESTVVYDECERMCVCRNGELADCYRIRKDFTAMSLEDRIRYIRALKAVSTLTPYKSDYDKLTKLHPDYFFTIHTLPHFFPFHRWYILKLENLLRKIDCRVTVPYWDWSRAASGNSLWRNTDIRDIWYPDEHGLGGNGTGPYWCVQEGPYRKGAWTMVSWMKKCPCLRRAFEKKPEIENENYVRSIFRFPQSKFKCFENLVRGILHGSLHSAIGGTMGLTTSSTAPEFWFHHGFMDKLWSEWQKRGSRFKFQYFPSVKERIPGSHEYGWQYMDLDNQPQCVKVAYENSSSIYPSLNKRDEDEEVPEEKTKRSSISKAIDSKCETVNETNVITFKEYRDKEMAFIKRFCP